MKKSNTIILTTLLIIITNSCNKKRHRPFSEKEKENEHYISTNGSTYSRGSHMMFYPHSLYNNNRLSTSYSSAYKTNTGSIKSSYKGQSYSGKVVSRSGFGHSSMSSHS